MDVFSHGLWSALAAKGINQKIKKPLNVWLTLFWGVFPDIFAFAIPFIGLVWNVLFEGVNLADMPDPSRTEPPPADTVWIFRLAGFLYPFSHSLVVFLLVIALVWFIKRKFFWEMGGWLTHILIDIPTHSYRFYPTPFLWPVSEFKFDGFPWGTSWFFVLNYSAIFVVYLLLRRRDKRKFLS